MSRTESFSEALFQELTWSEIRHQVHQINKELTAIIDKLSPSNKLKLIKLSYLFGDHIVKEGIVQIPKHDGKMYPLQSNDVPSAIKAKLDYSSVPLGFSLNKISEVYVNENNRIIPLKVFEPGRLFGTFETVDYLLGEKTPSIWNVSAGSRSIFSLPRISENAGLQRLKIEYSIPVDVLPQSLSDHWHLFHYIAKHKNFTEHWKSDVIFFTRDWFTGKKNDPAWFDFQQYLFKQAWLQSRQSIAKDEFGIIWQTLMKAISYRRVRSTPYLIDTLKHLLLISIGEAPAFRPVTNLTLSAPISGLQKTILDVYQLKKYLPTIMHAVLPDAARKESVYYSLAFPTLLEGTPSSKQNSSTIMLDLRAIKFLVETMLRENHIQHSIFNNKHFEYFHVENDKHNEIKPSQLVFAQDKSFAQHKFNHLEFCATSPFWRGCIQINFN